MNEIIAVILGGGAGTRLYPLTRHRAKPAVPLAGKYRLIDIPISNCINSGVDRIFVLTQFLSASLNRHVASAYRFDRFRNGFVTILAAEQTPHSEGWFQGTADAVRQVRHHVRSFPHSHVLVLSGDQLYRMDYRVLLDFHQRKDAEITIATIPVTADEAPAFGILKTDADGRITEFSEKPPRDQLAGLESPVPPEMEAAGRVYLASMGIYLFNRFELSEVLAADPSSTDFGKEIIPRALTTHRVFAYPFEGYWSDIGTIRSFYEATIDLASPTPAFDLYNPMAPIYTNARMLPPAKIVRSEIVNSMIADACVIAGARIEDSVIGLRSYIENDTTIRKTVMLGADYMSWHSGRHVQPEAPDHPGVGAGSTIEGAIIDKNVRIGPGCRIVNQDGVQEGEREGLCIRDGIVVIPKNTVIPDGTVI